MVNEPKRLFWLLFFCSVVHTIYTVEFFPISVYINGYRLRFFTVSHRGNNFLGECCVLMPIKQWHVEICSVGWAVLV